MSVDKINIGLNTGKTNVGELMTWMDGSLIVKKPAVFTGTYGDVTINNAKITAKTYQVNSGGVLKFIGSGTGEYYDVSANTVKDFVTGVQVVPDGNNYKLQKTTVYNSNWTDAGNFSRATTLSGAWSGSKYTVTASPQGNTKSIGFTQDSEVQLSLATNGAASEIPNGNRKMVSAPLRVYQTQGTTTTDRYTTSLTINAEAAWNHGWEDAAALTVAPSAGTGSSFDFKAPKYYERTQGNWVREQVSHTFTISKGTPSASGGYASVTDSGSKVVAKIPLDDWYTAGWEDAAELTSPPAAGTDETFIFQAPRYYEKTQGNWVREQVNYNFTITKGATPSYSGYAAVSCGGTTVGRINIGDWYTAGMNDVGAYIVTETQTDTWYSTWDLPAGDSITFYPAKWVINEFVLDEDHALTVTASGGGGGSHSPRISIAGQGNVSVSGRTLLGTYSSSTLHNSYLLLDAICGGSTGKYYISIN